MGVRAAFDRRRARPRLPSHSADCAPMPDHSSSPPPPPPHPVQTRPATGASPGASAGEIDYGTPSKPFQFSTRSLLIVTTVVAVIAAILPNNVVVAALLYLILDVAPLVCFISVAVYARGNWQAFALGAACSALLSRNASGALSLISGPQFLMNIAWVYFQYAAGGALAVLTRRFVESRGWGAPADRGNLSK